MKRRRQSVKGKKKQVGKADESEEEGRQRIISSCKRRSKGMNLKLFQENPTGRSPCSSEHSVHGKTSYRSL